MAIILTVLMLPLSTMADSFSMIARAETPNTEVTANESATDNSDISDNIENSDSVDISDNTDNSDTADDFDDIDNSENNGDFEENINTDNFANTESNDESVNTGSEDNTESENNELNEDFYEALPTTITLCDNGGVSVGWTAVEEDGIQYEVYRNQILLDIFDTNDLENFSEENSENNKITYIDENTEASEEYVYSIVAKKDGINIAKSVDLVIVIPSVLTISGDYKLDEDMTVYSIVQTGGTLDLDGHMLKICKNYINTQDWTGIVFNNGAIECYGNFTFNNYYGQFSMSKANDYLYVRGDLKINTNINIEVSNGKIETEGDFEFPNLVGLSYSKVVLSGSKRQEVTVSENHYFNSLEITNNSEEGVNFVNSVQVNQMGDLSGINIFINNVKTENGLTLEEDTVIEDDLFLGYGELNLNGKQMTVKGNLYQIAGRLIVGNGNLQVEGDYISGMPLFDESGNLNSIEAGCGILSMQDKDGKFFIKGSYKNFSVSSEKGYLTNGNMEVKGDFIVNGNNTSNFYSSDNHTVIFSGNEKQTVSFAYSSSAESHLNNLINLNESEEGLEFVNDGAWPVATGEVNDNEKVIKGYLSFVPNTTFENNQYSGNLILKEQGNLNKGVSIGGDLTLNGYKVDISAPVTVKGNMYIKESTTRIYSDITVDGDVINGETGEYTDILLYNGTFIIKGNFKANNLSFWEWTRLFMYPDAGTPCFEVKGDVELNERTQIYCECGSCILSGNLTGAGLVTANANNIFIFDGSKKQIVSVSEDSTFGIFEIKNVSEEGVECEYLYSVVNLKRNNNKLTYKTDEGSFGWKLTEDTTIEGDLVLLDDTLDLNGYKLSVKGNLIQLSGTISINKGELSVDGDYRNQRRSGNVETGYVYGNGSGILKMVNEEDYVLVKGDFISQTKVNHTGYLTDGTLEVKGDFYVSNSGSESAYVSTLNHTTVFSGTESQQVRITASSSVASRFSNVEFMNKSEEGLELISDTSWPYVNGSVKDNGKFVKGYLFVGGATEFNNNHYSGNILINENITLSKGVSIDGDLTLSGYSMGINAPITVKGNMYFKARETKIYSDVTVEGDLFNGETGSYNDILLYNGKLLVKGDYKAKDLTGWAWARIMLYPGAGTPSFEVRGDVELNERTQIYCECGECILYGNLTGLGLVSANTNNTFVFAGENKQIISISADSTFGIIDVLNNSEEGIELSYVYSVSKYLRHGNKVTFKGIEGEL